MKQREAKENRRMFAELRQQERDERGDFGQLEKLEAEGHGHCREAVRLRIKLEAENAS